MNMVNPDIKRGCEVRVNDTVGRESTYNKVGRVTSINRRCDYAIKVRFEDGLEMFYRESELDVIRGRQRARATSE